MLTKLGNGLFALAVVLPVPALAGTITIKGSDTMIVLGQRWAEDYMKKNPGTVIQVTGGGSGTGISALINGTTDICQSSRPMKDTEKAKVKAKTGVAPEEIPVAKDGLAIYVHASNPLDEITTAQLKAVYRGKLTSWKDLGGPDTKVIPYSRENNSGTYVFFKEQVLRGDDFTPRALMMAGTAAVVHAVSMDTRGIGYGGAAFGKGIKLVKVKKDAATPGVSADPAHVRDGSYPLSRPLFFYTAKKPAGEMKAFIDWTLSKEGQAVVERAGYFPIK